MDSEDRLAVLEVIEDVRQNSESPGSVTVIVGGRDESGMVESGTLFIRDAPSGIVDELREHGYSLSVGCGVVKVST